MRRSHRFMRASYRATSSGCPFHAVGPPGAEPYIALHSTPYALLRFVRRDTRVGFVARRDGRARPVRADAVRAQPHHRTGRGADPVRLVRTRAAHPRGGGGGWDVLL